MTKNNQKVCDINLKAKCEFYEVRWFCPAKVMEAHFMCITYAGTILFVPEMAKFISAENNKYII